MKTKPETKHTCWPTASRAAHALPKSCVGAYHWRVKGAITAFLSEYCATFILYVYFFLNIIIVPPEFSTHPKSQPMAEGKNVTLSCNASGNPESTSFSWTIGESPVNTTANPRISFSLDQKQLIITNVNRADRGPYRCVANNSVGNTKSNAATLDVQCKYDCFWRPVFTPYL